MPTSGLPTSHRLLACLVALIWGVNFLAIHASLDQFPPLFLVALRFTLLAIPTILFVPRPLVPTRWLVGYGLGFGVLQFTFLYTGMAAGMPAGLASLVLQASGPFTLILGALGFAIGYGTTGAVEGAFGVTTGAIEVRRLVRLS